MNANFKIILLSIFFFLVPIIGFYLQANNQFVASSEIIYPVFFVLAILYSLFIANTIRNLIIPESKYSFVILVATGIVLYSLYLFGVTWYMYSNFYSENVDLTYFHQYIWQLSEFKTPYTWLLTTRTFAIWSQHFSPFLAILVPIFWISQSSGLLLMEQAVAVLSGAIPIYFIAKRFLHSRGIGLALSFAYLSFGGLQFGMEYGFHEIMFFPVIFLWAYYFYISKRKYFYFLFIFLSLLIKEEVSFIVIFWSIYLIVFRKDRVNGIVTAMMGLIWSFICFSLVFPYFNQGKGFGYWGQYDQAGGSGMSGILKMIIFNPLKFLLTLVTPAPKIDMMLQTFGQFSFLLLLFPPALLIILPSLMEKLLSSGVAMANGAHYSAAICAVTIVATFEALPHIYKYKFVTNYIRNKNLFFTVLIFYTAFFSNIFFGFPDYSLMPGHGIYFLEQGITEDNRMQLNRIINVIPPNVTVSANDPIPAHLNRYYKNVTGWPGMVGTEDFVIVDTQFRPVYSSNGKQYNDAIAKLNNNPNYQLAFSNSGILVYRRKSFNLNSVPTN